MSKEQIEEMAEVLRHSCENECFKNKDGFADCEACEACLLYDAGYRKQSEWISVEERLPEREGKYLVYTIKGGIKFGDYRSYLVGEGKLCEPQFDYYVTHWMPLPEPPKMKCGAE